MADGTATQGQAFTLPNNGFTPPFDHRFKAWQIGAAEYQPGEIYTFTEDTTVEAVWEYAHIHSLTATEAKAATCEAEGNIAYWTCSGCGKLFCDVAGTTEITAAETVLGATGHSWGEWSVTTPASENAEGVETRICERDSSHTETRTIPKLQFELNASVNGTVLTWSATLPASSNAAFVFAAWYNENGQMLGRNAVPVDFAGSSGNQTIYVDDGAATYKLFILDEHYRPILRCWSSN